MKENRSYHSYTVIKVDKNSTPTFKKQVLKNMERCVHKLQNDFLPLGQIYMLYCDRGFKNKYQKDITSLEPTKCFTVAIKQDFKN